MASAFDSGAFYLLSYTNTLSFPEWREAVKQAYSDLEKKFGVGSSSDNLARMIAYYCLEIAPGPTGRMAASRFRKVHNWEDYRCSDVWWLDEWKERRKFDMEVSMKKSELASLPSISPDDIEHDHWSREALRLVLGEAENRITYSRRSSMSNMTFIEEQARNTIAVFGGWPVYCLCKGNVITDKERIPSLQTMYFVDRTLVEEYGDNLRNMKTREYN